MDQAAENSSLMRSVPKGEKWEVNMRVGKCCSCSSAWSFVLRGICAAAVLFAMTVWGSLPGFARIIDLRSVTIKQVNTGRSWDISKKGDVVASPTGKEKWQLRSHKNGDYNIIHATSRRYVAVQDGKLVARENPNAKDRSLIFRFYVVGPGVYTIQPLSGSDYLGAPGSSKKNVALAVEPEANSSSQLWRISPPLGGEAADAGGPKGNCLPQSEVTCSLGWAKVAGPAAAYSEIFSPACVKHDFCYRMGAATYGYYKSKCDKDMYETMKKICGNTTVSDVVTFGATKYACYGAAGAFYGGVKKWGDSHFERADTGSFCTYEAPRKN